MIQTFPQQILRKKSKLREEVRVKALKVADRDDGDTEEENYYNNEQVIYCKYYDACESSSGVCEFAQQRWKKVTIMLMILFNLYTCCCTYITSSKSVKNHIFVSNSVL